MKTTQQKHEDLLVNLFLMCLILLGPTPTLSHAAIQCFVCHGTVADSDYRPQDAITRDEATGGFAGNHQSHMAAPASPATCVKCHNNNNYFSDHRNGFINLSSNINASPLRGKYMNSGSQVTSKAQTATSVLGTCADVNCHFEAVTPQWGSALFTAPADCNKCHGAPPNGGATGTAGSHSKHDQYYAGAANCQKCHPNNITFQHATSAGKRNLGVSFAAAPNNGSGAYSGALNDYLPSQTNAFGSCTATYCHSPGDKANAFNPPAVVPAWGGASLTCKDCHKSDFASGSSMSSGSHGSHVNKFGGGYNTVKCVKCHALTAKADMTISNATSHVNGQIEIAFNNSSSAASGSYKSILATPASPMTKTPGLTTGGACTNVYCHSSGQGPNGSWPPAYTTPTWGGSGSDCGSCHGNQFTHVFGGVSPITSGSHSKHLQYQMNVTNRDYERCVVCHAYQRTGFDPLNCNSALCHAPVLQKHANHEINVGIPDFFGASAAYNGSTKPGDGYSTCSQVYCHSDGLATPVSYYTPTWGNVASGACGTCHGAKADSPPASFAHAKHVGSSGLYQFACSQCHAGIVKHGSDSITYAVISTASAPGTIDGSKLHVNKTRNVRFDATHGAATYTAATQTCVNTYCHSKGTGGTGQSGDVRSINPGTNPTWSGTTNCGSCHGGGAINGQPEYANGSPKANSHAKHTSDCSRCHYATTTDGTTIATPANHVNRSYDLLQKAGTTFSYTYASTGGSCSGIGVSGLAGKCHFSGTAAWGATLTCAACHDINTLSGAHKRHAGGLNLATIPFYAYTANQSTGSDTDGVTWKPYGFGCGNCHPLDRGTYHANDTVQVQLDVRSGVSNLRSLNVTPSTDIAPGTGKIRCSGVYCHSNGRGTFVQTPAWDTTVSVAGRCGLCHANSPASDAHVAHLATPSIHQTDIYVDPDYSGKIGATATTTVASSHGDPAQSTTISCNICHMATVGLARNKYNANCSSASCHGNSTGNNADALGAMRITGLNKHVNGVRDISLAPIKVISKAQVRPISFSKYSGVWARNNGSYKGGPNAYAAFDTAKTALSNTMFSNGTCSNVSCHNGKSVNWSTDYGKAVSCKICHDTL